MTAIIDYDAGNLRSVEKALNFIGEETIITRDPQQLRDADKVILPGVGAFGDAMSKLSAYGLIPVIHEIVKSGKPFLGICLGMQVLFESSEETPGVKGLGLLPGKIVKIPATEGIKIPHIGWNSITIAPDASLFHGIAQDSYVYFVHSYYLKAAKPEQVKAVTEYSVTLDVSVQADNIFGCQFHPEKSGDVGMTILRNFAAL